MDPQLHVDEPLAAQPEITAGKRTRQQLVRTQVQFLYRHCTSGLYYCLKKHRGKRREHSLKTYDFALAKRRMKEWIDNLDKVDASVEKTTFRQLLEKWKAMRQGKALKTRKTDQSTLNQFVKTWAHDLDIQVSKILPSHLNEWLALHEGRLKNVSYNGYVAFLKQVFQIAVADRIIAISPHEGIRTPWKKPQKPVRRVPTLEQFQMIVTDIRGQKYSPDAESSADFIEFLGMAGVGQAEAASLTWGDVDWELDRINFKRHKTQARYHVPIYLHLKPFMERLWKKNAPNVSDSQRVLKISDGKKALQASCQRLGLPNFSQRNIRQCLIMRLWKAGVDKKLIAKWQGHQDGGTLILDTYTEVLGDDDAEYEKQQLGKLQKRQPQQVQTQEAAPQSPSAAHPLTEVSHHGVGGHA